MKKIVTPPPLFDVSVVSTRKESENIETVAEEVVLVMGLVEVIDTDDEFNPVLFATASTKTVDAEGEEVKEVYDTLPRSCFILIVRRVVRGAVGVAVGCWVGKGEGM